MSFALALKKLQAAIAAASKPKKSPPFRFPARAPKAERRRVIAKALEKPTPRTKSKNEKSAPRKQAQRLAEPPPTPPRTDTAVEQLVERVHAELPEVFGEPTPKTVLEMFGPWDFGTPTGRVFIGLRREKPLERAAWRDAG